MFIVTASPILSASPYGAGLHQALEIHATKLGSDRVFTIQPGGLTPVNHSPDPAPSMGARALANWSLVGQGKRLALLAYARCWHPSRMPSAAERVSGGRFPCGPKTTTGYPLPTLRVGLAGRTGGEYLTHGRAGTGESELDATLPTGLAEISVMAVL